MYQPLGDPPTLRHNCHFVTVGTCSLHHFLNLLIKQVDLSEQQSKKSFKLQSTKYLTFLSIFP